MTSQNIVLSSWDTLYNGKHEILTDSPSETKCERCSNIEDIVGRRCINIGGTNQNFLRCGIEYNFNTSDSSK
jgi:hypothetical protein